MSFDPGSTGSSTSPPGTAEEYLARVAERLQVLPERDRGEILDETRSHIAERYGALPEPQAAAAAMADLGSPEAYAEAFLAEYGMTEEAFARPSRRLIRSAGGVVLAILAGALLLFGLLNVLTPPSAESVWFIWRDVGLGRYGWFLLFAASWILAGVAAIGAAALLRRARVQA